MKNIILIGIISLSIQVFAQNHSTIKVYGMELDTIANMVHKHPKYFFHLYDKARDINSKFKQSEWIVLYYGSAFMKNYHPKKEAKSADEVAHLLAEMDFKTAIEKGKQWLSAYPLNTRLYMLLGYAYKKIGEKEISKKYYKRYADIIRIPLYSGSGKDFNNAFVTRSTSDEFLILNYLDKDLIQQEVRYHKQLPYDVMQVTRSLKNNQNVKNLPKEKLYFNIYLPFFVGEGHTYKQLQEEAKRKYKVKENKTYRKQ